MKSFLLALVLASSAATGIGVAQAHAHLVPTHDNDAATCISHATTVHPCDLNR